MELRDTVAVVTGGASGIGRASALAFAREGADVVVADIDRDGSDAAVAEIEDLGRKAISMPTDVSKREQVERLVADAVDWQGRCDLFMSNAGVGVGGAVEHIPLEDWEWVVDINLWAHIWAVRKILPHMLERERGHLVHTASSAGTFGVPSLTPYAVTKFAVVGLAESLAVYCNGRGVGVSVVCPLVVATNIMNSSRNTPEPGMDPAVQERFREFVNKMFEQTGLPPEAVADAVVAAVRESRLYVFPHPEVQQILEAKLADPDAWVANSADVWRGQREAMEQMLSAGSSG